MVTAMLVKRKVFTPMGKKDTPTYDLWVGNELRASSIGLGLGKKYVKKLNK